MLPWIDDATSVQSTVEVHDATRLEWSVTVPIGPERATYAIDFAIDVPAHLFVPHAPWDRLQQLARLDEAELPPDVSTAAGVRRFAVVIAARLARASAGFARHCALGSPDLALTWLETATRTAALARATLGAACATDVRRERDLAMEYVSTRMLELVASAERALARALDDGPLERAHQVERHITELLEAEMADRRARGFIDASNCSPQLLERYVERASALKKHFQEVLFLECERWGVGERIHHVVAVLVALCASTWAFSWQLLIAKRSFGGTAAWGMALLGLVAGVVYAGKDRIKEVGRAWVTGKVHKLYAQRLARYRTPGDPRAIARAKESFHQTSVTWSDPLELVRVHATRVRYVQRGVIEPAPPGTAGVRVKHVFRYDLSPLFARLDDATKPVPVMDPRTRKLAIADASRRYRFPLRLVITMNGRTTERHGMLVLHKRGLDRVEAV